MEKELLLRDMIGNSAKTSNDDKIFIAGASAFVILESLFICFSYKGGGNAENSFAVSWIALHVQFAVALVLITIYVLLYKNRRNIRLQAELELEDSIVEKQTWNWHSVRPKLLKEELDNSCKTSKFFVSLHVSLFVTMLLMSIFDWYVNVHENSNLALFVISCLFISICTTAIVHYCPSCFILILSSIGNIVLSFAANFKAAEQIMSIVAGLLCGISAIASFVVDGTEYYSSETTQSTKKK